MADVSVQDLIRQEAARAKVPPELALAVAEQESSFNPTAVGPRLGTGESAIGTFQLLPSTAKRLGVDPHDPVQNVRGGIQYLHELLERHQGNLEAVLGEYGGVKTDTKYVPGVLGRMGKFQTPPPAATPPPPQTFTHPKAELGRMIFEGLDPRTSQGRRNIAGGVGAAAATALAPELALPAMLSRAVSIGVPLVGAYLGGATEQAGESVAAGGPPSLSSMQEAGRQQMGYEATGQAGATILKGLGRRVMASGVSKKISQGLSDALDAVNARLEMQRPRVSPGKAGQLVEGVVQGPSKAYKDFLGEEVGKAAESGPAVPTAPLKARLAELAEQITPMASHQQPTVTVGGQPVPAAMAKKLIATTGLSVLPPDHPLPATLDRIRDALADYDEIPFAEAHKIKTLLDSAVNWDRGAKKPAEQITKGFRQSLRSVMAGHTPYEEATGRYSTVARLYRDFGADKLASHIQSNPGEVVQRLKWQNPDGVRLLKEITDLGSQVSQGAQIAGDAAFSAVRAAWTNESLIAKGPTRMASEIERMEASNAGQEFIQQMFGDPAGQTQWQNLKQIAQALRDAQGRVKEFGQSSLAKASEQSSAVRDIAYAALPGHPITKVGAMSRLVLGKGTSGSQMLQWASAAPARTQFLIKHVLTGPDPGVALADFIRWWESSEGNPDRPIPSHEGPPPPKALARTP